MEIARTRKGRPDDGCNERDVGLSRLCYESKTIRSGRASWWTSESVLTLDVSSTGRTDRVDRRC